MNAGQREVRRAHFTNSGKLPQTIGVKGRGLRSIQVAHAEKLLRIMVPRLKAQPIRGVQLGRFHCGPEVCEGLYAVSGVSCE